MCLHGVPEFLLIMTSRMIQDRNNTCIYFHLQQNIIILNITFSSVLTILSINNVSHQIHPLVTILQVSGELQINKV